ncbi:hypothetical protein B0H17DRAFT_1127057 [Mycena rosella]|uniref:Uncharacterized protein n=1 Tax=Mycena rosella TaxID=1033263 RepID=A0AAD7M6U6_MYCRO|nr:hypothetical protein B0H17DRAFT_1127057 [Mycena rosella]
MHAFRALSLTLISAVALVAANPLLAPRETCGYESPTGCPGCCSGNSLCVGYCETNRTDFYGACGETSLGCILDDDGTCFTGKLWIHTGFRREEPDVASVND